MGSNTSKDTDTKRHDALFGAELMLMHAAEKGIAISEEEATAIMQFRAAHMSDPKDIPIEIESKFWAKLTQLASKIRPSNMEALRSKETYEKMGAKSPISRSAFWFSVLMWSILSVTIVCQAYYASLDRKIQAADLALGNVKDVKTKIASIPVNNETLPPYRVPDGLRISDFRPSFNDNQLAPFVSLLVDYCSIGRSFAASIQQLHTSYANKVLMLFTTIDKYISPGDDFAELQGEINRPCASQGDMFFSETDISSLKRKVLTWSFGSNKAFMVLNGSKEIRAFLSQFVLPFAFGLLGAIASVVRSLSISVDSVTYVSSNRVLYLLRIPLGALAGATVGLLFEERSLATIAGLTTLGIAFAVGYAVEVFFAALDGLIGRLVGRDKAA
ncbi:MAG: hypothetical protein U1E45_22110 [Geminicoccaceae bacterium]